MKTRRKKSYGAPCEAVTLTKQRHIRRTAEFYLLKEWQRINGDNYTEFRFDVAEVMPAGGESNAAVINYIEDAFR